MRRMFLLFVVVLPLAIFGQSNASPAAHGQAPQKAAAHATEPTIAPPPPTPVKPVTEDFFGTKVVDDYRWLENLDSPKVEQWSAAQTTRARNYLNALPVHQELVKWLTALAQAHSPAYYDLQQSGGTLFATNYVPGTQQPMLVTLKSPNDLASRKVVIDPNKIDPSGHTAIQFYSPSVDGRLVAVCLAEGGSEAGNVHVYETATGKALSDVVPRVNFPTAGGSVQWKGDGSGFYYTRYPHPGERPKQDLAFYQQVYFHKLGTPTSQDQYILGKDFPRIAEITLSGSTDGKYVLATVENGDGGDYEHFLRAHDDKWQQITHFGEGITAVAFGPDDALYMVSHRDAPRGKLLRVPASSPDVKQAKVIVPESNEVIEAFQLTAAGFVPNFVITKDRLYVVDVIGGPNEIRVFDHAGKELGKVQLEPVSAVTGILGLADGNLLYRNVSYVSPGGWFLYEPQRQKSVETAMYSNSPVDFSDIEAVREFATSKDGTKIPVNIIRKKGTKLDGDHPTILTGYGGFGLSLSPFFDPSLKPWLEAGGIYAIANLRGGGEYGEQWHEEGMLTKKQNVFDDFIASAEHLIQTKYTNPQKLGIEGGSNGGLLMGAVLTQRPELFRCVVSVAGLYDMLRMETTLNGQFNVTEYGSVKNPAQFKALYAYSPYQHVRKGVKYPAILLMVGQNDQRVDPWHSFKFAAKLQADTASKKPIFLISFANAGHGGIGAGENQRIAMAADNWTFQFNQLHVSFPSVPIHKNP